MAPKFKLTFENCSYVVPVSLTGKPVPGPLRKCVQTMNKELLKGVSASVSSGHVLAIMGPSGAGKTTLLNMLTLQRKGGSPCGCVLLNGKPITRKVYRDHCAYVQQQDVLWASLTTREHLGFAFHLFQPGLSNAERDQAIDSLLDALSLRGKPETTRAGNQFTFGLSGGLKRRLSIALALAKSPSLLFLDEPTTGVDSASAAKMMGFLKAIAAEKDIAVACTIHQPPASVFEGFDDNIVLASGRVAYFGAAATMGTYFGALGRPPTAGINLAEFVLDQVNKDFTSATAVDEILDAWSHSPLAKAAAEASGDATSPLALQTTRASVPTQIAILTRRNVVLAFREPMMYTGRMGANCFATTFFGILYVETRKREQDQIQARCYFAMFTIGIPVMFNIVGLLGEYFTNLSIKREIKDGMFHPLAAAVASWIVQVPAMVLLALCGMVTPFAIGDWHWGAFGTCLLVYAATSWCFEGMAQCFALAPHPLIGLMNYMQIYFGAFLFCGMFIDLQQLTWVLRWASYVLPLKYTLKMYVHALFINTPVYDDAMPCAPGSTPTAGLLCSARGFYCPADATGFVCFGREGDQILVSLGDNFAGLFEPSVEYAKFIGFIVAIGLFFRMGYVVQLMMQTSAVDEPAPVPTALPTQPPTTAAPAGVGSNKTAPAEASAPTAAAYAARATPQTVYAFCNVTCTLPAKRRTPSRTTLRDASAVVPSGEVLAIIGPSDGDGTTLLSALSLERSRAFSSGRIELNGVPITPANYPTYCSFVPRTESLWPMMTARKHLEYTFALVRPELTGTARAHAMSELLAATGLTSCQHTRAGDAFRQGLSGGQRRRLALALALASQPKVLLLDEPTSGLDSAAAAAIMKLLKAVALSTGASVLCTIQQPSAAVYEGFDQLMVLADGRVAYSGSAAAAEPYFAKLGKVFPATANPAEFLVDEVSKDMKSAEAVAAVLDAWTAHVGVGQAASMPARSALPSASPRTGFVGQMLLLTKRSASVAMSDPVIYAVRAVVAAVLVSFFGVVYLESANQVQEQVVFRLFYLWWQLCVPASLMIMTVFVQNMELRTVGCETKNGYYSTVSYILGTTLVQLPFMALIAVCASVPAFALGGWPWEQLGTFILAYMLNLCAWEAIAQVCSLLANPILGMLIFMNMWASGILFCGLVFRATDIIWPFRLFVYIFPLKHLFHACAYDIYHSSIYSGAFPCTPGSLVNTSFGAQICRGSFYCPDVPSTQCAGYEGPQVLRSIHMTYETIDSDDSRIADYMVILAIGIGVKLTFGAGVILNSRPQAIYAHDLAAKAYPKKTAIVPAVTA